jgi:predicted ATPase
MYLSRFGVKNYKCLADVDIPLTPIHVLIGQNDAGKTSLLEAIAVFCGSADKQIRDLLPGPWEGRELVTYSSPKPTVELRGEWSPLESDADATMNAKLGYGFAVEFPETGRECFIRTEWIETGGQHNEQPKPGADLTVIWRHRRGQPRTDLPNVDRISSLLRPAPKYAFEPRVMAVPAAIDPNRKFRLEADGFGLATLLDDILGYDANIFLRLREAFCGFFPQFRSVRIESENAVKRTYSADAMQQASMSTGKGIYFETRGGQTIRAQQASDGAILFLGFLALAHVPDPPTLLLIEEPENGIYPMRLGEVITLLRQLVIRAEGVRFPQIIMSTHSPYVLSFFEPEEVTFLSRPSEPPDAPVRARPLRDAPHIRERLGENEFYLGELWYNLSEEELFSGV